jgi:hypothetical protein
MIEEFENDDSFFEECLKDGGTSETGFINTTKKESANLWSERSDDGTTSQTSSGYGAESSQASLANCQPEDCSDEGTNADDSKKERVSERSDSRETSQPSSANAESSQASSVNDISEGWFDGETNTAKHNASENKKERAKLWSDRSDSTEILHSSCANAESSQASSANDISEAWFDDIDDDWDGFNFEEPNAKRKRL